MKDSLIKGTIILALAAFVARFLGMLIRAPLLYLVGEEGMAAYNAANSIYLLLLIIATAGIPSTLSKMISERLALNREQEANQIYKAAIKFSLTAGFIMTVLLYAGAPAFGKFSGIEESTMAIRAIAPAMLLFPLIAIMRGYFQGRQMMKAGGLSQIYEQILRVITAVGLAYLLLKLGSSVEWAVAGASFGAVTGSLAALAVMIYFTVKIRNYDRQQQKRAKDESSNLTNKQIYSMIFKLSIPISLISIAVPAVNMIDSAITVPLLQSELGQIQAKEIYGILGAKAQSLAGIPPILAIALSASIVPIVSSAFARGDHHEVSAKTSQTIRISLLTGLPVVLVLIAAARPINGLLFPDTSGTGMIIVMLIASMFQILMMTSAAILMGMGRIQAPMYHVLAGIVIKIVFSVLLSLWLGIYGIIIATGISFIFIFILNYRTLKKIVHFKLFPENANGFILSSAVIIAVGLLLEWGTKMLLNTGIAKLDYLLQSGFIGGIMGLLYMYLAIKWKAVPKEDVEALPGPLRKVMRILQREKQRA